MEAGEEDKMNLERATISRKPLGDFILQRAAILEDHS
jgi:hypothetical protein